MLVLVVGGLLESFSDDSVADSPLEVTLKRLLGALQEVEMMPLHTDCSNQKIKKLGQEY